MYWENGILWVGVLVRVGWEVCIFRGVVGYCLEVRDDISVWVWFMDIRRIVDSLDLLKVFFIWYWRIFLERINLIEIIYEKFRKEGVVVF